MPGFDPPNSSGSIVLPERLRKITSIGANPDSVFQHDSPRPNDQVVGFDQGKSQIASQE